VTKVKMHKLVVINGDERERKSSKAEVEASKEE
jgi:hypothetical protein